MSTAPLVKTRRAARKNDGVDICCIFCLGAADTLLGDRLGLGSAFRQGFAAVVDLLLLMTGFMALAPWLGTHLAPVITPVFSAVGCDPSLFASLF